MKVYIRYVAYLSLLLGAWVAQGGAPEEQAAQLEQAAVNREWSAAAREQQGWGVVAEAEKLRQLPYADAAQAHRNMSHAVGKLRQGADLLMASAGSYDLAARNWEAARKSLEKAEKQSQADHARDRAERATQMATHLMDRAAEVYESGIEIAADMGEAGISLLSAMSDKAAAVREKLATR
jgi:Skp family chaperone for outer membrane proteins